MADAITTGAQAAVQSLKGAQATGKQLGQVVVDQQRDMENSVQEAHRARLQAKAVQEFRLSQSEFRAVEKYEHKKAHDSEILKLKQQTIAKHGKNAWTEVESIRTQIEREQQQENNYMSEDRRKIQDLFFWCLGAAALVTYFFKLYKL